MHRYSIGAAAVALLVAFHIGGDGVAADRVVIDDEPVTFAADVAIILQENCQVCHHTEWTLHERRRQLKASR
jgi:hypothetical protein